MRRTDKMLKQVGCMLMVGCLLCTSCGQDDEPGDDRSREISSEHSSDEALGSTEP